MILMCDCCDVEFNNPIRCGWEERIAVGDPYWISEEIHSVNLLAGVGINQYGDWVFRDGLRSIVCDHCAQEADALIQDGYAV